MKFSFGSPKTQGIVKAPEAPVMSPLAESIKETLNRVELKVKGTDLRQFERFGAVRPVKNSAERLLAESDFGIKVLQEIYEAADIEGKNMVAVSLNVLEKENELLAFYADLIARGEGSAVRVFLDGLIQKVTPLLNERSAANDEIDKKAGDRYLVEGGVKKAA